MRCEVCGHRIMGKHYRVVIEGAKMVVCGNCAKLSSTSWEVQPPQRMKRVAKPYLPKTLVKKQPLKPTQELELVDNFSLLVRQGREKLGLSHEDLGKKIGEKVSVLRKVERGKMTPVHRLAGKLEHTLRIKLLVLPSEPKVSSARLSPPHEVTLGEAVRVRKRKTEVTKEREQS